MKELQVQFQFAIQRMYPTPQEKTKAFLKTIEAGDLALYEPFPEALAVFGFTKAGKTSTCHMLANSTLKAEFKNGDLIYRQVSSTRFTNAKVGTTNESETEIPNVFQATFRDKSKNTIKIAILDQPGYGDSYGFHRIFSNGYFHYRTLSKTPKLKFLVVLERKDLSGVAEKLKKVILLFINSFTPYEELKGTILNATCFLISKAEVGTQLTDIIAILKILRDSIGGMTAKKKGYFQEFINNMIDNNKIFIVEKPRAVGNETQPNSILQNICEKTVYWERPMEGVCTDMKNVNFSVAGEVLSELSSHKDNELFNEDFDSFMKEMKSKIECLIKYTGDEGSLINIVNKLVKDAESHSDSCQFLESMAKFVQKHYNFDIKFKNKREELEATLFNIPDESDLNDSRTIDTSPNTSPSKRPQQRSQKDKQRKEADRRLLYFIKKFKVLDHIKNKADDVTLKHSEIFRTRTSQTLQFLSAFFVDIFRKFDSLRTDKKGYEKTISRYCYIIQRLIDESKVMIQILFSDEKIRQQFLNLKQTLILNAEILTPLEDLVTAFNGLNVNNKKREYIERLNLDQLDFPVTREVIDFFQSVPELEIGTQIKIARLLLKYSDDVAKSKKVNHHDEMKFLGSKLLQYHIQFTNFYSEDKRLRNELCEVVFLITKAIAASLQKQNIYESARKVLSSIRDAEGIFHLFEAEIKYLQPSDPSIRNIYLQYAKTAMIYQRTELAVRCCQLAYSRSSCLSEMKAASKLLIEATTKQPEDKKVDYLCKLFEEEYCDKLAENVLDLIKPFFGIKIDI